MARPLHNPEVRWQRELDPQPIDRQEIIRRVDIGEDETELLSGGLANQNIRIGKDRVLRIYRRDEGCLALERRLLSRAWDEFRVPRLLHAGSDFLVLEFVPHTTLNGTFMHGLSVGRALAEIHQTPYDHCGILDGDGSISESWSDFLATMVEYLESTDGPAALLHRIIRCINARAEQLRAHTLNPVLLHGDFKVSNLLWTHDERLLVLDWEFAYAGPAYMDLGQLIRWGVPKAFADGFEEGYSTTRPALTDDWQAIAHCFDLVNLTGLMARAQQGSRRALECEARINQLLDEL